MNELKIKNGLIVDGAITASALHGTASQAISASWAPTQFQASASWASSSISSSFASQAQSASFASQAQSASFASLAESASFVAQALSASYANSASFALSSVSASYANTASVLSGFNFDASSSISTVTASNNVVIQKATGSLIAAFYDYAIQSGSNIRAGTVFGSWVNGVATYSEYTTVDVGDTSQVSMSLVISAGNVQLLSNAATSVSWSVKAIARYL
jgi:hypothetical protein